jgi:hypothetical protein
MQNWDSKLNELINKTEWSNEEKLWMLDYFEHSKGEELRDLLQRCFEVEKIDGSLLGGELTNEMLQNIHDKIGVTERVNRASIYKMWGLRVGVACIIGLLALTTYSVLEPSPTKETARISVSRKPVDVIQPPPGTKALLTLADGSIIVLDDKKNGFLTSQGNTKVLKFNGKLVYNSADAKAAEVSYNTITTPAKGQYQIELPDGSLVWLNAGSSLHFPTAFVGKQRRVEVTGEAYFEVKKNVSMPFAVKVNNAEVQVLGTKFNVMAYKDETALKTTLFSGEVKFVFGDNNSIIKPGQQTQLSKNGRIKVLSGIDLDEVIAWKNGMFDFQGADLVTVTRQLSRWYGVELIFDKKNDDIFYAKIPMDTKLKDALKALELTGKVRFVMEGRRTNAGDDN